MNFEFDFWNHYCKCSDVIAQNEQPNLTFYRYNHSEDPLPEWYDQSQENNNIDIQDNSNTYLDELAYELEYELDNGNYTSESSDYDTDIDDEWTTV